MSGQASLLQFNVSLPVISVSLLAYVSVTVWVKTG